MLQDAATGRGVWRCGALVKQEAWSCLVFEWGAGCEAPVVPSPCAVAVRLEGKGEQQFVLQEEEGEREDHAAANPSAALVICSAVAASWLAACRTASTAGCASDLTLTSAACNDVAGGAKQEGLLLA
jgi:hypothetical protein